MKRIILFAFFTIFLFFGCSEKKDNSFDYGHVENNTYYNSYFDFEIDLIPEWHIQSREQTERIANMGKNIAAGEDSTMQAALKASEIKTANLLAAFQHELGAPVNYNPNIMIIAENLVDSPGVKNGSDYLFHAKKLLKNSQIKYDYISEKFTKEKINNTDFHTMETNLNYMGLKIKQKYYSTVNNDFSFNVTISYVNDSQKAELMKMVNSMKFN